ncbi:MAG: hypothetical protein NT173_02490 [Opitutales bacterium]|nr:hypothetical protein [Opitutales bacterium]
MIASGRFGAKNVGQVIAAVDHVVNAFGRFQPEPQCHAATLSGVAAFSRRTPSLFRYHPKPQSLTPFLVPTRLRLVSKLEGLFEKITLGLIHRAPSAPAILGPPAPLFFVLILYLVLVLFRSLRFALVRFGARANFSVFSTLLYTT